MKSATGISNETMSKILFAVRSQPDFERFCSIVSYLRPHDCTMLDFGDVLTYTSIHHKLLIQDGLELKHWSTVLPDRCCNKIANTADVACIFEVLNPSLLVIDQFGPDCCSSLVACRDEAMRTGVPCCMVPHGVQALMSRRREPKRASSAPAAVVCYTSEEHFRQAAPYYAVPGTYHAVLGDPRFDEGHITRLRSFASGLNQQTESNDDLRRVAFFESRFPPGFRDDCIRTGQEDPEHMQWRLVLSLPRTDMVKIRHHPRSNWPANANDQQQTGLDSIYLSSWAHLVLTGASTIVCEALVMSKRCWTLDCEEIAPTYESIFTRFSVPLKSSLNMPPLLEIVDGKRLLTECCWAGGDGHVAKRYAEMFNRIAIGNYCGLVEAE